MGVGRGRGYPPFGVGALGGQENEEQGVCRRATPQQTGAGYLRLWPEIQDFNSVSVYF